KDKEINFKQIPICIEAENENDLDFLKTLAQSISKNNYEVNSEQRANLHLAAVFVNNFVNQLYYIGSEICNINELPFQILQPLIQETAKKIKTVNPLNA